MTADESSKFLQFAKNIAEYVRKLIKPDLDKKAGWFRATTTTAAANNTVTILRQFDETPMTIPCVSSFNGTASGSQCIVLVFGSLSNAIVIGDGTLSNL